MAGEAAIITKESPVALLLLKLEAWMVVQPEWLLIVNLPRQQRRAAMRELANRLYTIPIMDGANTVPRVVRRKVAKELSHVARTQTMTEAVGTALVEAALQEELEALKAAPDPEGDVKADIEAADAAEAEEGPDPSGVKNVDDADYGDDAITKEFEQEPDRALD